MDMLRPEGCWRLITVVLTLVEWTQTRGNGPGSLAGLERADNNLNPLKFFELGIAGRCHGTAQCTGQVRGAVGGGCRPGDNVRERSDLSHLHTLPARKLRVVCLRAPMVAATRGIRCSCEHRTEHDCVGTTRNRLHNVTGCPEPPVCDDVHIPATGLFHILSSPTRPNPHPPPPSPALPRVAPRAPCHIGPRRRHGRVNPERGAGCGCRAATETHEHPCCAGTHEVECRRVCRDAANDDGNVQLVDELFEVQWLGVLRDVFCRHGRAADDEEIDACGNDRFVEFLCALWWQ